MYRAYEPATVWDQSFNPTSDAIHLKMPIYHWFLSNMFLFEIALLVSGLISKWYLDYRTIDRELFDWKLVVLMFKKYQYDKFANTFQRYYIWWNMFQLWLWVGKLGLMNGHFNACTGFCTAYFWDSVHANVVNGSVLKSTKKVFVWSYGNVNNNVGI